MHRVSKISVGSIVFFSLNFCDVMWKPTISSICAPITDLNELTCMQMRYTRPLKHWSVSLDAEERGWQQAQYLPQNLIMGGFWVSSFVGSASLFKRRKNYMICMAYLHVLVCTVFKCSSAECVLTRRRSSSSNLAYQFLATKINIIIMILNPIYWTMLNVGKKRQRCF